MTTLTLQALIPLSAPATLTSMRFWKHNKLISASEPLQLLFPLSELIFSKVLA